MWHILCKLLISLLRRSFNIIFWKHNFSSLSLIWVGLARERRTRTTREVLLVFFLLARASSFHVAGSIAVFLRSNFSCTCFAGCKWTKYNLQTQPTLSHLNESLLEEHIISINQSINQSISLFYDRRPRLQFFSLIPYCGKEKNSIAFKCWE